MTIYHLRYLYASRIKLTEYVNIIKKKHFHAANTSDIMERLGDKYYENAIQA